MKKLTDTMIWKGLFPPKGVTPWGELFPEGRVLFYEGDNPEQFVVDIITEFGLDPSGHPAWESSLCFHCPPQHLDGIYGSGR